MKKILKFEKYGNLFFYINCVYNLNKNEKIELSSCDWSPPIFRGRYEFVGVKNISTICRVNIIGQQKRSSIQNYLTFLIVLKSISIYATICCNWMFIYLSEIMELVTKFIENF